MGFELVTEVLVGVLIGWLIDHFFGTGPYGLIIGALLGVIVAMTNFLRQVLALNKPPRRSRPSREPNAPDSTDPRK